jgi:hypothetical protein
MREPPQETEPNPKRRASVCGHRPGVKYVNALANSFPAYRTNEIVSNGVAKPFSELLQSSIAAWIRQSDANDAAWQHDFAQRKSSESDAERLYRWSRAAHCRHSQ